jgi:hypothetical protein
MTNDRFRDAIYVDFGDLDIETKQELSILMRRPATAYRRKENKTEDVEDARHYKQRGMTVYKKQGDKDYTYLQPVGVTQDQLDGAWDYLKGKTMTKREDYKPPEMNVHYYHKQIIFRDKKTGRFTHRDE